MSSTLTNKTRPLKSPWRAALIWPDSDWKDAERRLFGLGRLERLLLTLASQGIEEVILAHANAELKEALGLSRYRDRMPLIVSGVAGPPLLVVHSNAIFDARLMTWFAAQLDEQARGILYPSGGDSRPIIFSIPSAEAALRELDFEAAAQQSGGPRFTTPPGHICLRVLPEEHSSTRRGLWILTRKPVERWEASMVRRLFFPVTASLASRGVRPNTLTWISFCVAVAGCILLTFGDYAGASAGALTLYAAWVLDCLDGSLSRLTFQASEAGAKLDTDLGRIAYALTGAALGWAIFGRYGAWKQALVAALAFALGGFLSIVAGLRAERIPAASRPLRLWRLHIALDNLLHRDNTLILLACALMNRLSFFLWFLIVVLNVSWMVDAAVLLRSRRHGGLSSPPHVPPDPARTDAPS